MQSGVPSRIAAVLVGICLLTPFALAENAPASNVQQRIAGPIDDGVRASLAGSLNPHAVAANDAGAVSPSLQLQRMALAFTMSAAQQADLASLLAAQQDPASPLYHQWLTPAQFGALFGMSDADLAKAEAWLQAEGFTVDGVSNARNRIYFSGTAAQVAQAFATELHYYKADGETHFAPSSALSLPAALAPVVQAVVNLNDYRPKPQVVLRSQPALAPAAQPEFTSSQTGQHYLTPDDVATIYDVNPVYNAGYNGAGQTIAIMGQSAVVTTDITNFQTAAGVPVRAPNIILVPNTGTSATSTGDEAESDLDLEYSSGIGRGATIDFVYTGNSQNNDGVFTSLQYTIDNDLAPIISISYGGCEPVESTGYMESFETVLDQASAQGETVIASAGDSGATGCYGAQGIPSSDEGKVAVNFPADSPDVTAMGGTEFPAADNAATNDIYWKSASGSDIVSTALSYIPEIAWNDDAPGSGKASGTISSGGGGVSTVFARPAWQSGVPGIPSGSFRLVPDISLAASPDEPGYLFCSSDNGSQGVGVTGSCSNGFRDSSDKYLTVAGGTSFDAPIFAGMLSLLNQRLNTTKGQGNINSTLYSLASRPTIYASAFHDITSGSNDCAAAGSSICTGAALTDYPTTVGYDEATGLGSIDLDKLLAAWSTSTAAPTLAASTTSLTAATLTPASGASDVITIKVASSSLSETATPTGAVVLSDNGNTLGSVTLSSGAATYTFSSTTTGAHTITATYSGDSNYASSSGTISVTVGSTTTQSGSFSLSAGNINVAPASQSSTTVTVTPAGGFTGTVAFSLSPNVTIANACYTLSSAQVTGTAAAVSTLTVYTSASQCSSAAGSIALGTITQASTTPRDGSPFERGTAVLAFAGLFAFGFVRRKSAALQRLRPLLALSLLAVLGVALSGCGSQTSTAATTTTTTNSTDAAAGTYTLTITGTSGSLSAKTTSTLVIE